MGLITFRAKYLFTGNEMLGSDHILEMYDSGEVSNLYKVGETGHPADIFDGLICPGFINCHCHLELSHLKDVIPTKIGLVNFISNVLQKRTMSENVVLEAIEKTEAEMFSKGISAVGDICNTAHTLQSKGQSKIKFHSFIETIGFDPSIAANRLESATTLYQKFVNHLDQPVSIVPHAPYSVSPTLFQLIDKISENKTLSIHSQECSDENLFFTSGMGSMNTLYDRLGLPINFHKPTGKSSIQSILPFLHSPNKLLLVHNTFIESEDLDFINNHAQQNNLTVFYCLCPLANLFIENCLPPLYTMLENDANIVLGTDSYASNHCLDIWEEIKTILGHFPKIGLEKALGWATLNGAKALGFEGELGSFDKGKRPGVVGIKHIDESGNPTKESYAKRLL